jgi:hypothetical protein
VKSFGLVRFFGVKEPSQICEEQEGYDESNVFFVGITNSAKPIAQVLRCLSFLILILILILVLVLVLVLVLTFVFYSRV